MSKTRLSNIELLRILSMFMIVLSHFAFHGFWRGGEERYEWVVNPLNHIVLNECYIGGVGVNLFVMISGYFLIGSQSVNIRKLFNLIGKVTFYSLLFYIVAIVFFDVNPNVKEIVNALLPWVYSYWFVGAYLILYVLHPYINIVINTISEKRLRFLCFLLLSIWGIPYTFLGTAFFGNEMTLFVTMYTIGGYFRKWGGGISKSKMLVALWCSITLWLCIPIVAEFVRNSIPVFSTHVTYFLSRQSFIAIFLSVSLFYYFAFILKCNENPIINKTVPLLVLFSGHGPEERNKDFFKGTIEFNYINLDKGFIKNLSLLRKLLKRDSYKELILGGWDNIYMWLPLLFSPKQKNSIMVESSIHESQVTGIKGLIKKLFVKRCSKAYVPGKSNVDLVQSLGFDGTIMKTKGCGIFNYIAQPQYKAREKVQRFIYVGRLAEVKNLKFLISVFNELPELTLDIVGFGPLENDLKAMAANNIIFHGAVDNTALPSRYGEADVFILPSRSEPWGIVVEEALNNGLPIIVSDKVGCAEELVDDSNGLIFKSDDADSLKEAIKKISDIEYYNRLRFNISKLDFEKIEKEQVECYL